MDTQAVARVLVLDPGWAVDARSRWRVLMDLVVWGDLGASQLGAMPRLRKRALETGERLQGMVATRDWIPHPREQLKQALASALVLNQAIADLRRAAQAVDTGRDREALNACLGDLEELAVRLTSREQDWAALLDAQYRDDGC